MLKGLLQPRNTKKKKEKNKRKEKKKDLQNQPQAIKKLAIRTYISKLL